MEEKKKISKQNLIIVIAVAAVLVLGMVVTLLVLLLPKSKNNGNTENAVTAVSVFSQNEYVVKNGDSIAQSGADRYVVIGGGVSGVSVSNDGVVTVSETATNGTQLLIGAVKDNRIVDTAIITISLPTVTPTITFDNLSTYVVSGERISAQATPSRAVSYSLKTAVEGITVEKVSGTVFFSQSVTDGTEFTVVASVGDVKVEHTFKASVGEHVTATTTLAYVEYDEGGRAMFTLDYGDDAQTEELGVLGVRLAGVTLTNDDYAYDSTTKTLSISKAKLADLPMGENQAYIYTARNTVAVTVVAARYIRSAEDLASINNSAEALAEHYVMVKDIDLTDYLKDNNDGCGWKAIGYYQDGVSGQEETMAFRGVFDGNGHTVSGLYMNWSGEQVANAFNAGLFGYTSTSAEIKNLCVKGSENNDYTVRSFSGVICGANNGIIRNCIADCTVTPVSGVQMIGAFVGRNNGSIYNSYAVGSVEAIADTSKIGAFVGENASGEIYNCYAVTASGNPFVGGENNVTQNCSSFTTVENFIANADFSGWDNWTADGENLPLINSVAIAYELNDITVTNEQTSVVKGESFVITVIGDPVELFSSSSLTYEVLEGNGVAVSRKGIVDTSGADIGKCVIRVRCGEIVKTFEFDIIEVTED